jgi:uncharacterized Zn-binding protein involved in type VI secretion
MGMPAALLGDNHVCPLVGPGPVPHVGGPVMATTAVTVLITNKPAAVMGDMAICTGPPDTIAKGSGTVLICNMPAARVGDTCAHGGAIVGPGAPTVLIGG